MLCTMLHTGIDFVQELSKTTWWGSNFIPKKAIVLGWDSWSRFLTGNPNEAHSNHPDLVDQGSRFGENNLIQEAFLRGRPDQYVEDIQ